MRTRRERVATPIPITYSGGVDEAALAERRQEKADETAANLYENLHAELMRTRHERDEALVAVDLAEQEIKKRDLEIAGLKTRALPDSLQVWRELYDADNKTDQPPAAPSRAEAMTAMDAEYVDVVIPPSNGTAKP